MKGDLTNLGTEEEYAAFLAAYGRLGARMHHVRGNHDAMLDPTMALEGAPFTVDVGGVDARGARHRAARHRAGPDHAPSSSSGSTTSPRATTGPVLVFGHHHLWDLDATERSAEYFGINPDDSEAFGARRRRAREHRRLLRRPHAPQPGPPLRPQARDVPFVEISCTKDYPGVWAEYRHLRGRLHPGRAAHLGARRRWTWTERTRPMFAGLYRAYALGHLDHRCFTETW